MTTPAETKSLLRFISTAMDRPIPPTETEDVWSVLLADVPLVWAKAGAAEVLATSPYWPKPAEIIIEAKRLAAIERDRQQRQQQLALGAAEPPKSPVTADRGPCLVRALLAEVAAQNKGVTGRDERRRVARQVAAEFRKRVPLAPPRTSGEACTSSTCRCTHTDGCDAGWIDVDRGDGEVQAFPCPSCNPRRHTVLTKSGGNRSAAQRALRDTSDVKAAQGEAW